MLRNKNNKRRAPVKSGNGGQRIVVRLQPRKEPELRRLARALIELARLELEAEQSAEVSDASGEEAA